MIVTHMLFGILDKKTMTQKYPELNFICYTHKLFKKNIIYLVSDWMWTLISGDITEGKTLHKVAVATATDNASCSKR